MKKFNLFYFMLLIVALSVLSTAKSFAQTEGSYTTMKSTTTGLALDTVTNTGVRSQVLRSPGFANVVTIVATVTEISGTTAGAIHLFGSLDGVGYAEIDTTKVFSPADITTAQSYAWHVNPSQFTYYKTTYTGAGTMAAKVAVGLLKR